MKPIIKKSGYSDYHLSQAHQKPPLTADEATSRWKSFGYKDKVQEYLLNEEQYGLCCYSELRADLEGLGYHIEHVQPKSHYPSKTFDYNNLAVSALSSDNLATIIEEERFAGHHKLDTYNQDLFISCHDHDCNRYFFYLSDGHVIPNLSLNDAERERAQYTIDVLNLDSPYLVILRRHWYDELGRLFDEHINKNWSLEYLAAIDLLPTNQKLSQFFSVTRQFFDAIAERVLQKTF